MSDRVDRLFVWAAIALSFVVATGLIRNFEYYWLYLAAATTSTAGASIFLRWFWIELRPEYKSYLSFLAIMFCFWLVVWFWYVDDFLWDYWPLVFVNSLSCAALCSILYWQWTWEPTRRPYLVSFIIALAVVSVVYSVNIRLDDSQVEAFRFIFVPVFTVEATGFLALIWWGVFRRPFQWWQKRRIGAQEQRILAIDPRPADRTRKANADDPGKIRSDADNQTIPVAKTEPSFDSAHNGRDRVAVVCPRGHTLRVPAGKSGKIRCPVCNRDGINTVFRASA
jgi:hypothetical protein